MINPRPNQPLSSYSTMRLGGPARFLVAVHSPAELTEAIGWAEQSKLAWRLIGGGSNIVFTDAGFDGLIIVNAITGLEQTDTADGAALRVGAGEIWDTVVERSCRQGLYGLAELSMIPGSTGASPVQNIGAYGREASQVITSVSAYDSQQRAWVELPAAACEFAYRRSIFNTTERGRYAISHVSFRLSRQPLAGPVYESLARQLADTDQRDPATIRQAVMAIRARKLPDPSRVANLGSFFKNPVVDQATADRLLAAHPSLPTYPAGSGQLKLAAGWLIEHAGLKGYASHGLRTYQENALVIINDSASGSQDLLTFRDEIIARVKIAFGVELVQEPEIIGSQT